MSTPSSEPEDDRALHALLRESLQPGPGEDSAALQDRVMAQWRQRHARNVTMAELALAGGSRASRGVRAPVWLGLGGVMLAVALAMAWTQRSDPVLEELMQPDVLSQIGFDEI
jgi:type VI protein secretion system component VasF